MIQQAIPTDQRLIVSLYDYSGQWPRPYINAGYPVMLWDYKVEGCILQHFSRLLKSIDRAMEAGYMPYGMIGAPPCDHISSAGAQYWPVKDQTEAPEPYAPWSVTEAAQALVEIMLHLRTLYPWKFWVAENPPGRMERLVPEMSFFRRMMFDPCDYGDPYTKRTVLWGEFNANLEKSPVQPETVEQVTNGRIYRTSAMMAKKGGKSERTKTARSNTPPGFSRAFFLANQ